MQGGTTQPETVLQEPDMPTSASQRALEGLRDLFTLEWYVIPLLAIVFYIYTFELKKARASGNWDAVFAGLTVFAMDFVNETWNGWIFHFTGHSAFWTTPGKSALKTMVGWNIEIMFMFAISGIIYYNTLSEDKNEKILGLPNRWFWAIGYSACRFITQSTKNTKGVVPDLLRHPVFSWIAACEAVPQSLKSGAFSLCHSGLDPESSAVFSS